MLFQQQHGWVLQWLSHRVHHRMEPTLLNGVRCHPPLPPSQHLHRRACGERWDRPLQRCVLGRTVQTGAFHCPVRGGGDGHWWLQRRCRNVPNGSATKKATVSCRTSGTQGTTTSAAATWTAVETAGESVDIAIRSECTRAVRTVDCGQMQPDRSLPLQLQLPLTPMRFNTAVAVLPSSRPADAADTPISMFCSAATTTANKTKK